MRKPVAMLSIVAAICLAAVGLASCGSSGGKEGGTLTGSFAGFPDYLDPGLAYSSEGWTAMYNTYVPLLTYAHADGAAGSQVIPGLVKAMPKITDGGKTYTMDLQPGLHYSDGTPIVASDFTNTMERDFKLNSPGTPFYTDIVGAEKFAETKKGGITGIETNDKTGHIVIHLTKPRGTFTFELGLLFAAPLPPGTPARNLSSEPPPASGPYMITNTSPSKGWEYERNPEWTKHNSKVLTSLPSGHVDKIDISIVRNDSTMVNEIEQNRTNWMQPPPSADRFAELKEKYEGTQFRVEPTVTTYFFWMNTRQAPFDDLKVRQAVNYAINPEAMERIYSGSLTATHQILPPAMPGYKEFDLYPYDLNKAKQMIKEANPSDRDITVWTDNESPNDEAGAYYADLLGKIGFNAKLKTISADNYLTVLGNESTPDLDTGWFNWYEDYPHPNDFFQPMLSAEAITPTNATNMARFSDPKLDAKAARLREEEFGPEQEAEYAELDKEYMEQAPWAPYGSRTVSTFVDDEIELDKVIFNPTFGQDLTSFQFK